MLYYIYKVNDTEAVGEFGCKPNKEDIMYKKEDVFDIRNNEKYDLTELDRRIFDETGYVIHQVDYIFEYKQHFGSVYGQTVVKIYKDGSISAEECFCNMCGDTDYETVEVPENIKSLLALKYQELINGYWKDY